MAVAAECFAEGANWGGYPTAPYNANLPAHTVTSTPAEISAQTAAGSALRTDIRSKITTGETTYTVPPGVYRFNQPSGVINVRGVNNFTLHAAGCIFIMSDPKAMLFSSGPIDKERVSASNITIEGSESAPLIVDSDLLPRTQGTIKSYDPATGDLRVAIMPGYATDFKAADHVTAFTSAGLDFPYGYYHSSYGKYTDGHVVDAPARIVQLTTDKNDPVRFAPGNFVVLPTPNKGRNLGYFWATAISNLTLKDIAHGCGGALLAGQLDGETKIIRVKNGPIPGTNRLWVEPFAQTSNRRGSVLMDGCEFGGSYDDAMDIQSSGIEMYYQTSAANPAQILVWRMSQGMPYAAGDTISIYNDATFANICTAKVTAAVSVEDSTVLAAAEKVWNSFNRRKKNGGCLVQLTLDKPVRGATPGDYVENDSDRMTSFTMTNCYWHQIGVRVMIEGIQQGTFTHNTFDGVNGGLALVCDTWWGQGGTCQNVTIDNNLFRNCFLSSMQAHGALVLGAGKPVAAVPGQKRGFQYFTVTNNTFIGRSLEFIHATNVGDLTIAHNVFQDGIGGGIGIYNCGPARVVGNRVVNHHGPAVTVSNSDDVTVADNFLQSAAKPPLPVVVTASSHVTTANNTTN